MTNQSPAKRDGKSKVNLAKPSQMLLEWVISNDRKDHEKTGFHIKCEVDENQMQNSMIVNEEETDVMPIANIQPMVSPRGGSETTSSSDNAKKIKKPKGKRELHRSRVICLEKIRMRRKYLRKQNKQHVLADKANARQKEERDRLFAARRSRRLSVLVDPNDVGSEEQTLQIEAKEVEAELFVVKRERSMTIENELDRLIEDILPGYGLEVPSKRSKKPSQRQCDKKAKRQKTGSPVAQSFADKDQEEEVIEEVIEEIWHVSLKLVNNEPKAMFLVKWEGYPPESNTVEPYEHVQHADCVRDFVNRKYELHGDKFEEAIDTFLSECLDHQESYRKKPKSFVLAKLAKFDVLLFKCNVFAYIYTYDKLRHTHHFIRNLRYQSILYKCYLNIEKEKATNQWLIDEILSKENNSLQVVIENYVDFDTLPKFEYLRKVSGYPKSDVTLGCSCKDGCYGSSKCCPKLMNLEDVYDKDGRICAESHQMIVECNEFCKCALDCPNRPKSLNISMRVFKTADRGWALKTMQFIPAGSFVIEYTGELIDEIEAKKRSQIYDKTGLTYLFDLDYNETGEASYSIDATDKGNLSRFINHSCQGNLQTWPATSCNENVRMHRLYYFSLRPIRAGEELTVDYCGGVHPSYLPSRQENAITCKCGSALCKGYIF